MPAPTRYQKAVPEMVEIWTAPGNFRAQGRVWEAQCMARHELYGVPSAGELKRIRKALKLTQKESDYLSQPIGHETNRFLSLVQKKLPKKMAW